MPPLSNSEILRRPRTLFLIMVNSLKIQDFLLLEIERWVRQMLDTAIAAHYFTREQVRVGLKILEVLCCPDKGQPVDVKVISEEKE
jgi:hypothetical protein